MRKLLRFLSFSSLKAIEITVGIAIVIMVVLGFCLWQMSSKPFDLMFAEDYIARALSNEQYRVDFRDVDLKWPDMRGPLRLDIKGVEIHTASGDLALSVDQIDIGLSTSFLMVGMIRPVSVYLDKPTFRMIEDDTGRTVFLLQGSGERAERAIGDEEAKPLAEQLRVAVRNFAEPAEDDLLRRFRILHINQARVVHQDKETGREENIAELNAHFTRTRRSASVNADILMDDKAHEGLSGISLSVAYDRQDESWAAQTNFRNLGPAMASRLFVGNELFERQSGAVNGRFAARMDKDHRLTAFEGRLQADAGEIYWPQEYDAPIAIGALDVALSFDPATQSVRAERFSVDINGVPVQGVMDVRADAHGYRAHLDVSVPEIGQTTLETFFPKSELDGELAEWLVHRMDGGVFRNVTAQVPLGLARRIDEGTGAASWQFLFDEADMYIGFEAEGVDLVYQDTLMPARDIKGHGFFDGKKLDITGESGRIEDVEAREVHVVIDDVAVRAGGYAHIDVKAVGPLSTLLRYIADEPIAMGAQVGFKPEEVKGIADLHVTVGLPTLADLPKEEVKVKVSGTIDDVLLPRVVQGLDLTGGLLTLETVEGGFGVAGNAMLAGVPATFDMTQYFDAADRDFLTQVEAKITSTAALRRQFGVDLSDYISGEVPLDITYLDDGKGRETVAVTGDLTPAALHIRPFGYTKKEGTAGTLSLNAVMPQGRLTQVENLSVESSGFALDKGRLTFRPSPSGGAELSGGNLPTVRIGRTAGHAAFEIDAADIISITATAPVFDARPFLKGNSKRKQIGAAAQAGGKGQPLSVRLSAGQVIAENGQEIEGMKLYAELDADADLTRIELTGRVGESDASVLFRPDPQTGRRFFRLETLDAGALLAAAGVYENVRGGSLLVVGEPKEGESSTGNLHGTAQLQNFHVVKAPALAKLLSLMSLTGMTQILGQQGLGFDRLEADFEWRFRREGNMLLIGNGRTAGSSVGLTFDGSLDRGADITDIRGTIIPMTEINNVLKNIPLIGNILTGGSGLIAATYTMRGPSDDPTITVNPLSVLAPGFLRTLLFEGGFQKKLSGAENDDASGKADVKPPPAPARTAGQ